MVRLLIHNLLVNKKGLPVTQFGWGREAGMEDEILKLTIPSGKWKILAE
jgi:hypothetical protein